MYTDILQSFLNYTRAFKKDYVGRLVDVSIMDIVNVIFSSNFFASNCRATYVRHNKFGMMVSTHHGVLVLLGKFNKDSSASKTPGITSLGDGILNISSEEDNLPMIAAAKEFVGNGRKAARFHTNTRYRHAKDLFDELRTRHAEEDKEQSFIFVLFLQTRIQQAKLVSISVTSLFFSTMNSVDYEAEGKLKK